MSILRQCRWLCHGNVFVLFCFGTTCGAIMFSVATGTTIFLLPRPAVKVSAQSIFLKCLWVQHVSPLCLQWPLAPLHHYFLQPGQAEEASALSIFLKCLWVQHVVPLCLQWPLGLLFPLALAGNRGHCSASLS
jgi:hypothetical protein